jgi:hypothetical protein
MRRESLPPDSPEAIVRALSHHGAFLKKHVVKTLRSFPLRLIGEEVPASFAHHLRAADLIACDPQGLFLIFECKKVAAPKRWIFVRDMDDYYRVARKHIPPMGVSSVFSRRPFPHTPVCSDFYQYDPEAREKNGQPAKRADPQAIYEAATQLCGSYLGFVQQRLREIKQIGRDFAPTSETYIPVLVTNAQLTYLNVNDVEVNTSTGELLDVPELFDIPHAVLNFPLAAAQREDDFRREVQAEDWKLRFQESLYVVNVNSLGVFLSNEHRKTLVESESEPRARKF